MTDKLFTKRLRDLTDEAIRESLAEIGIEFEKRFGPAALTASPPVVEREAIADRAAQQVFDAFSWETLTGPENLRARLQMCARQAVADAILALTPVEGVGETTQEQCAKVAERIAECANTSGRSGCCETTGVDIATAIRDLSLSTPVAQWDEVRDALKRIDKFVTDYLSPWGSWKTPWWEGEVSDEAAFSDDNALKHCANIARSALATLTKGARDAG